jgi:putative transposase
MAPTQVYARLLDHGIYHCSVSTMYRILRAEDEVRERRNQRQHRDYKKPELLATAPNQVWSWDITKLRGPEKLVYYHLYVILDIFSRYVVGWLIADRESGALAEALIQECCIRQNIEQKQLIIHSDRGTAMTSKPVSNLLAELQVTKSLSRPRVSNDNPYSESQFKTLKYHPEFPDRFGSLEDARLFCRSFIYWYNNVHYHTGLALLTPATVHYKRTKDVLAQRSIVLQEAHALNPDRFVKGVPRPAEPPKEAWINPPVFETTELGGVLSNCNLPTSILDS